ncbi:MogA/MoaB family molybdenum cofactor biosynthesis protein [Aeromicrobium camelliae]|uniref:MogA/MoaB family molybdenum cofactor biosynthesis protein n=1 Tax=Aeromicrobium camelliae TaxID=1538144 RepID=A0A3N6ZLD1_9ACTN|nr:MogA/MoaB family molybdenum cofactor biosynthesis protein [Aeromicrobium camelliae]RQN07827.1 MogA/MoaB family molybdenum cofactor biosynthesis protein [Aeromicrobium camelliae]
MPDVRVGVVVASTRAAAGEADDTTGPLIEQWIHDHGWQPDGPHVVADGLPVERALRELVAVGSALVVTTGGTGLSPDDETPERTRAVIDRDAPGIAERLRNAGLAQTPLAVLSRGIAGIAGRTLIVNLPGSRGGVRDGLAVLDEFVAHALAQLGHTSDDQRHPPREGTPA